MKVELVAMTRPHLEGVSVEDFTAYIARIGKVKDNPKKLIKYLIKNKHWSPFEHTYVTFKIETSRAIGRQLLRHRSFSFQELSQRYEEALEFEPIELRMEHPTNRQSSTEVFNPILYLNYDGEQLSSDAQDMIDRHLEGTKLLYEALLKAGVAKETARMILPETTKTTMLMTGNLRSWIHFLAIRLDEHAQKEVREISKGIQEHLLKYFEETFKIEKDEKASV